MIFTGEQVRQADGPWLGEAAPTHTAAASEPHLPAPPPPSIRALWEGDAQLREEAIASIPPTVRHEIEQRAQRALLQELRSELAQRLPAVLQQNQHVLRHTVDEALRAALRQAPQKTTVTQTTQTAQTAQTTQTVADTDTDTVKQRQQQHSSSDPLTQTRGLDGEDVRPERH
ncbi:hypothetical protein CKO15_05750 [Halorhodospira abdelmalekii]|nr:hypothetical protein [Halorhodospira abdelmalekii]